MAEVLCPFRLIIAPLYTQAELFRVRMDWPRWQVRVVLREEQLRGYLLDTWQVWFLQGLWPCHTHEDVERMLEMERYARFRGADLRRWYT